MVEWCWRFSQSSEELLAFQDLLPPEVYLRSHACFAEFRRFAEDGSLGRLDRALGLLSGLSGEWDHLGWIAQRTGRFWPPPMVSACPFQVVRQSGWSRVTWTCPNCKWELSWQCESAAWEQLVWPGLLECPMGCANTNSGDPLGERSRASEFAP